MQHARYPNVAGVVELSREFGRDIHAGDRRADDLVVPVVLGLDLGRHLQAPLISGCRDLHIKLPAADEFAIRHPSRGLARDANDAIRDAQRLHGGFKVNGGHFQQLLPCRRCRLSQLLSRSRNRAAADGASLIDRSGCLAHHHRHLVERHVQLLGDDLCERRPGTGDIHLAREHGDASVLRDGKPGVEFPRVQIVTGFGDKRAQIGVLSREGPRFRTCARLSEGARHRADAETDDQCPAALQQPSSRDGCAVHARLSQAVANPLAAARLMARMTRRCEPHRHSIGSSACLISSSLGSGLPSSSTLALMIMPFMQ